MDEQAAEGATHEAIVSLREQGASFAYLHGSRAADNATANSDVDIAAYFGRELIASDILLPDGVDLLVLDSAPLEIAGKIALHGRLLFEVDQTSRINWEARTRKIYSYERPRIERAHREFLEELTGG